MKKFKWYKVKIIIGTGCMFLFPLSILSVLLFIGAFILGIIPHGMLSMVSITVLVSAIVGCGIAFSSLPFVDKALKERDDAIKEEKEKNKIPSKSTSTLKEPIQEPKKDEVKESAPKVPKRNKATGTAAKRKTTTVKKAPAKKAVKK